VKRSEQLLELAGVVCLIAAAFVTFGLGAALATAGALSLLAVVASNLRPR